jgi:hypothetical protein
MGEFDFDRRQKVSTTSRGVQLQRFHRYRIPKPQLPSGFSLQEKATLHDFEKGYIHCETALNHDSPVKCSK